MKGKKVTKDNEYVQINGKLILAGVVAGIIASLWVILPFFISGVSNLLFMTVGLGIISLIAIAGFNKKMLIKSGVLALGVFILMSYLIVPLTSSFFVNNEIDISQYENGKYETANLALPGLFCEGCAYGSKNALKGIPGVVDAEVSFNDKRGIVVYDPNLVTPEELVSNELIQSYGGEVINR